MSDSGADSLMHCLRAAPAFAWWSLSAAGDQMVERGYITERDYAAWEEAASHPEWKSFLWFLTSIWGRKPDARPVQT